MPELTPRTLSHYAVISFTPDYWKLPRNQREEFHNTWLAGLRDSAKKVDVYQVFPAQNDQDILIWSTLEADDQAVIVGGRLPTNSAASFVPLEKL